MTLADNRYALLHGTAEPPADRPSSTQAPYRTARRDRLALCLVRRVEFVRAA